MTDPGLILLIGLALVDRHRGVNEATAMSKPPAINVRTGANTSTEAELIVDWWWTEGD